MTESQRNPLSWRQAGLLALIAVVCFHIACTPAHSGLLALAIVGYVICLVQLARLRTTRQSFYTGLAVGFACFAPQLECFWRIFGAFAIALWLVLAFWIALFLALAHLALTRFGLKRGALLVPFLWTGLEYFRSELYYLKFSWLNLGFAFTETSFALFRLLGVYGVGFILAMCATLLALWPRSPSTRFSLARVAGVLVMVVVFTQWLIPNGIFRVPQPNLVMSGIQLEFPTPEDVRRSLNKVLATQTNIQLDQSRTATNVDLIVLSEYTLDGEPTKALKGWCRTHQKFLIVGGKDSSPGTNYYNTAFVISTNGEVVFKQVKSVPIQFFKDGLPAPEQKLWNSPWGKIGICICYDLCYTRVTDELVRQGAQMLIVPTMDVADWGQHQHELHARVAPVRAAEYGIPIFRVASSGISQGVDKSGVVHSSAPFPGQGNLIFFGVNLRPGRHGSLPLDRYLGPLSVIVTCVFMAWLLGQQLRRRKKDV
jgi:apolipoprotein N-acyltransferase